MGICARRMLQRQCESDGGGGCMRLFDGWCGKPAVRKGKGEGE